MRRGFALREAAGVVTPALSMLLSLIGDMLRMLHESNSGSERFSNIEYSLRRVLWNDASSGSFYRSQIHMSYRPDIQAVVAALRAQTWALDSGS